MALLGTKMSLLGPTLALLGPKLALLGPKMALLGAKMALLGAKEALFKPKPAFWGLFRPFQTFFGSNVGQNCHFKGTKLLGICPKWFEMGRNRFKLFKI